MEVTPNVSVANIVVVLDVVVKNILFYQDLCDNIYCSFLFDKQEYSIHWLSLIKSMTNVNFISYSIFIIITLSIISLGR